MQRIVLIFVAFFVSLSLTAGTIAHAIEPISCVDNVSAASMGHSDGDGDQVPFDAEKDYAHHHGGCHGHQICDSVYDSVLRAAFQPGDLMPPSAFQFVPLVAVDPALRPPIA